MMIIFICLLMENKSLNLNPTIVNFTIQFISEVYLMDLVLMSLEKYL